MDYWLLKKTDDFFDLTAEQKKFLRGQYGSALAWHRRDQLPKYISYITYLKKASRKKLTFNDVEEIFSRFLKLRGNLYYRLEPTIITTLQNLSEAQIKYFENALLEKRKELYDEEFSLKESEYLEKRFEKSVNRLEYYFDSLSKSQKNDFYSFIKKYPNSRRNRLKTRMKRQIALLNTLKQNKGKIYLKKSLRALFLPQVDLNRTFIIKKYVVGFGNGLDQNQKNFFIKRFGIHPGYDQYSQRLKDRLFRKPLANVVPFSFNKEVTKVFDDMVRRSIPFYEETLRMCAELSRHFYRQGTYIYDLGCSTGNLVKFLQVQFSEKSFLYKGFDNSKDMLTKATSRFKKYSGIFF